MRFYRDRNVESGGNGRDNFARLLDEWLKKKYLSSYSLLLILACLSCFDRQSWGKQPRLVV